MSRSPAGLALPRGARTGAEDAVWLHRLVMVLGTIRAATVSLLSDRASRLIAGIGLSVVACLVLLGTYLCYDMREGAWRKAARDSQNLLALIEEGVGRSIRMYDLSLRSAARLATKPEVTALDTEMRRLVLFDQAVRATGLGTIVITDRQGRTRLTSDPEQQTLPELGALPEFQRHREEPEAGLIVSGPRPSRMTGRPIMSLTRRIDDPDGAFAGIVAGAVHLDYFQALFGRLHVEGGSAVNIFHRDGTLLVRSPANASLIGRSIAQGEPYRRFRAEERGLFLGQAAVDGKQRYYAFANVQGLPLIVTVAVGADSIRDAWIYKAAIVAALILGLSALTFGLTVLLQREVGRRAAAETSSRAANVALSLLARTDGLTGLPNRRSYDEVFAAEWDRAAQTRGSLALLIVDADHFKQFNDRFGHHRGDEVLKAVADCVRRSLNPGAIGCRIGGEEFAAILPGLDMQTALTAAERIRRAVVNLQIAHASEVGGVATVSIGLACASPRPDDAPNALFLAADAALYEAKSAGRNRVRASAASAVEPAPTARRA